MPLQAQVGVITLGLQVKPVIPFGFFDPVSRFQGNKLKGSLELTGGKAFGMLVRAGITPSISFETGIAQIDRHFDVAISHDTTGYNDRTELKFIGYEIPVMALVFIRLGERTWMNNALGFSVDMYPSDVERVMDESTVYVARKNWALLGVVGNLGVEYRTLKSGTIYLGATYHRPFGDLAQAELRWYDSARHESLIKGALAGSYLTVDLRYFFHTDPERPRAKKAKRQRLPTK
jgi:hypothetical protein